MKKTVLITGASSGFGRETAKLFQKSGWNVVATMRSPEKEQEINQLSNVLIAKLDVQDANSIKSAVESGIERFGRIDVLINNAGYALMGVFELATEEQLRNQFEVNVFGMMKVTQAVIPHMRKNGKGAIVNISSVAGLIGFPFASLYESSKFAVEGFSEALHFELSQLGIKVKIVEPGSARTNFGNAKEMVKNEIEEYNPLMSAFFANYPKKTGAFSNTTPEEVAATIYKAAIDDNNKFRYIIGEDCQFFADLKQKNTEEVFLTAIKEFLID